MRIGLSEKNSRKKWTDFMTKYSKKMPFSRKEMIKSLNLRNKCKN